ncbi:UNKNOWN [Stylonychia lemnae]|uniref:Selenoprotein F/M domain-containing protein n=1 Tax=Stylonychia lemnae TaxID=5949 RepID=A0A078BAZ6_STYLE|nr:UNKNOWN [Stylonychia lemnae]|eukprot:CDW91745.1 UNKNOWN [Stylonychia lemnae]
MRISKTYLSLLVVGLFGISMVSTSHIDDTNGELSNFSFDRVVFRTVKDCSLDKIPDIKYFLEEDGGKYPKLDIYLSEGEPRFELSKEGKVVDTIRVGRYNIKAIRNLLAELGVKRDESHSYEKKAAVIAIEQAFKVPHEPPPKPAAAANGKEDL